MVLTKTLNRILFGTGLLAAAVVAYVSTAGNSKIPLSREAIFMKGVDDQAQAAAT